MTESNEKWMTGEICATPSLRVVHRVAAAEGVDPTALDPPLYEAVDPAALDQLYETATDGDCTCPSRVSFRFHGYDVTVESNGRVKLD
ncbi:hypothetical protein OB905_08090 [Halobacteria archaeon AArc-dxtr1]|nr:hypothetical protein [Halobacteria archaeon AArc-dxtr1]